MVTWSPIRRVTRAKQVDPSTLIFAYTPVEDPAVYAKAWSKPAVPTSFLPRVADEGGGGTIGTFGTIGTVI
jgi:hypothetical protein